MQANTRCSPGEADYQQITSLCDDLSQRIDTARQEQALLGQLVTATARTRPFRSRHYYAILDQVRARYRILHDLLLRYCR